MPEPREHRHRQHLARVGDVHRDPLVLPDILGAARGGRRRGPRQRRVRPAAAVSTWGEGPRRPPLRPRPTPAPVHRTPRWVRCSAGRPTRPGPPTEHRTHRLRGPLNREGPLYRSPGARTGSGLPDPDAADRPVARARKTACRRSAVARRTSSPPSTTDATRATVEPDGGQGPRELDAGGHGDPPGADHAGRRTRGAPGPRTTPGGTGDPEANARRREAGTDRAGAVRDRRPTAPPGSSRVREPRRRRPSGRSRHPARRRRGRPARPSS